MRADSGGPGRKWAPEHDTEGEGRMSGPQNGGVDEPRKEAGAIHSGPYWVGEFQVGGDILVCCKSPTQVSA